MIDVETIKRVTKSDIEIKVEVGERTEDHDVYITYNGYQWSGFTCRTLDDLEKLYYAIGEYLQEHDDGKRTND